MKYNVTTPNRHAQKIADIGDKQNKINLKDF